MNTIRRNFIKLYKRVSLLCFAMAALLDDMVKRFGGRELTVCAERVSGSDSNRISHYRALINFFGISHREKNRVDFFCCQTQPCS